MVGSASRKIWLTFGGAPVPDTDSGSLFHFPHHCGIADFRFISSSHTFTARFLWNLAKWLTPTRWWIHDILWEIWQSSGSGLIRRSGFESRITFGWNFGIGGDLPCWCRSAAAAAAVASGNVSHPLGPRLQWRQTDPDDDADERTEAHRRRRDVAEWRRCMQWLWWLSVLLRHSARPLWRF